MASCDEMNQQIYDYIDGILSREERKIVEKKIEADSDFRAFYNKAMLIRRSLKGLARIKPSDDFETILRARIRVERSLRRRSFLDFPIRVPAYVFGAAVIVALAFAINNNLTGSNEPTALEPTATVVQGVSTLQPNVPAQRVNFPMDSFRMNADVHAGTPLNSKSFGESVDSLKNREPQSQSRIRNVDYEF
jgi:anti-sigma factor RsiW